MKWFRLGILVMAGIVPCWAMELDVEEDSVDPCAWRTRAAPEMDVEGSVRVRHLDSSWPVVCASNLAEVLHWAMPMIQSVLYPGIGR